MGRILIDEDRCKGCELCTTACPQKLILVGQHFNHNGYHPAIMNEARKTECTGCALCARMCPDVAITVYR